jgi:hypothetical protein
MASPFMDSVDKLLMNLQSSLSRVRDLVDHTC